MLTQRAYMRRQAHCQDGFRLEMQRLQRTQALPSRAFPSSPPMFRDVATPLLLPPSKARGGRKNQAAAAAGGRPHKESVSGRLGRGLVGDPSQGAGGGRVVPGCVLRNAGWQLERGVLCRCSPQPCGVRCSAAVKLLRM